MTKHIIYSTLLSLILISLGSHVWAAQKNLDPGGADACETFGWDVTMDFSKGRWLCCPKEVENLDKCFSIDKRDVPKDKVTWTLPATRTPPKHNAKGLATWAPSKKHLPKNKASRTPSQKHTPESQIIWTSPKKHYPKNKDARTPPKKHPLKGQAIWTSPKKQAPKNKATETPSKKNKISPQH